MKTNMSIEEFNEKITEKILTNFERYNNGIIKNIDEIRIKMCSSTQDFITGLKEEPDNVFMLVEYRRLILDAIDNIKYYLKEKENIIDILKKVKEYYVNQYLKADVSFNSTSLVCNFRKLSKIKAYQNLIEIINMQIKSYNNSYTNYFSAGKIKED